MTATDPAQAPDVRKTDAPTVRLISISPQPLVPAVFDAAVADPTAGAHSTFCGVVRSRDHGRTVAQLEYLAYPGAQDVLAQLAEQLAVDPEVTAVAVGHRVGLLEIGDVALVAAVASTHRAVAFASCARLVDEIKAQLPVWKRQVFADGTDEWVNCP